LLLQEDSMLSLWLKTHNNDVYLVKTCRQVSLNTVMRFIREISVSSTEGLELEALLPHLDLPPYGLTAPELEDIRTGELAITIASGDPEFDLVLEGRLEATYCMELFFFDGSLDRAFGDLLCLCNILDVHRGDSDLPALYTNEFGEIRMVLPGQLTAIGRVERLDDEPDGLAA
jgi:hypothetical protein